MKKTFALLIAMAILSVAAVPSFAQGRDRRRYYDNQVRQERSYDNRSYYDYGNRDRSFWEKHRDKLTVAGAAVGGGLLGALIGGKKGAVIGAAAGAGGSALYTYKIRNKNRPYWRR